jgi:polyisoprenoid-binding protein YceI
MRRLLAAIAVAGLMATPAVAQGAPSKAPAGTYVVDKPHASITWKGLHNGLSYYSARFNKFDITLDFNPDDVTRSKVTASVDLKSVETDDASKRANGQSTFNGELARQFLGADKTPQATFTSTSVTKVSDTTGKMTGNVSFMGVSKPVTFDITYVGNRPDPRTQKHKVGFQAVGVLKRSDFGVAVGGPVADEIRIEINAEFAQK